MYQKTGIFGFDELFEGEGLLEKNVYMVKGVPGSGKTTFGIQYIYNGITKYDQPGIIISFEESPHQLYRDALKFGWDLKKLEEEKKLRVVSTSPATVLQNNFVGLDGYLANLIKEMGIKRVVVDSITHFKRISRDEVDFRENLYKFVNGLKMKDITAVLISEYEKEVETADYVVDGVIYFRNIRTDMKDNKRTVEIFKTRGQGHVSGDHFFDFESGIKVYPLLYNSNEKTKIKSKEIEYIKTGIGELDNILGGGFISGTLNLIVGSAGVGKTIFATNFLKEGFEKGENVLYLSLEEIEEKYRQFMKNIGFDFEENKDGRFIFWHEFFDGVFIEKVLFELNEKLKREKISRVVIDTLNDLFVSVNDTNTKKMLMNTLKRILENNGVTALCITEEDKITGEIEISDVGYSFIADSIIIMRYLEVESNIRRILTVLKARGLNHSNKIAEYSIKPGTGIVIKERLLGLSGLMSGNPMGELKKSIEDVFQPLIFLEGMSDYMSEEMSEEDRIELIGNFKEVLGNLKSKLREQFNIKEGEINGV